jgi:hypothetical protein
VGALLFIIVANMLSKVWFLRGKGTERHWGSGQRQVLYAHLNQRRVSLRFRVVPRTRASHYYPR